MAVEPRRSVSVDHTDLWKVSPDYEDYEREFIKLHFPLYCEQYGKPSGYDAMEAYKKCLRWDLRKALMDDFTAEVVPKKWTGVSRLTRGGILTVILLAHHFKNIVLTPLKPDASTIPAVYDFDKMMYVPVEQADWVYQEIEALASKSMTDKQVKDTYITAIALSETVTIRRNRNEIPCENYIYDESTGKKIEYGPDVYLLNHGHIDYNPKAKNPHFYNKKDGTTWDWDSWLLDLFDGDEEMVDLFYQIVARIIRPFRPWVGVAMFVGDRGNNGKGTLIHMMRHLVGQGAYAPIDFAEFAERFGLNGLIGAQCILCDENDMDYLFTGNKRLKAATDGDSELYIELKYRPDKIPITFPGFVVECVNDLPRMTDKTDSMYRRIIPVPFNKCFTGIKREYIKEEYLISPEVLEYVKRRAIETEIKSLEEAHLPKRSQELLAAYKIYNDPIRAFWTEVRDQLVWNTYPTDMVYDLYASWFKRNNPSGRPVGKNTFKQNFKRMLDDDSNWEARFEQNQKISKDPSGTLPAEPLIAEYNLTQWYNPNYRGTNLNQRITGANVKDRFRGILRVNKQ